MHQLLSPLPYSPGIRGQRSEKDASDHWWKTGRHCLEARSGLREPVTYTKFTQGGKRQAVVAEDRQCRELIRTDRSKPAGFFCFVFGLFVVVFHKLRKTLFSGVLKWFSSCCNGWLYEHLPVLLRFVVDVSFVCVCVCLCEYTVGLMFVFSVLLKLHLVFCCILCFNLIESTCLTALRIRQLTLQWWNL